ncbi:MAG: hypothetical protein GY701_20650 [Sulfitobacter sp.]|nr:hypothetical protein [Sulfitobacter sp.]
MSAYGYDRAVRIVSALLYAFDPGGMGSTVFAPEDEYDEPARRMVAGARSVADVGELVRGHYPESGDQLVAAVAAALELYLSLAAGERSDESDG